jgi:methylated-DNA-[protein]-cysteine S-methyltransferase
MPGMIELLRESLPTPLGKLVLLSRADGALVSLDFFDLQERREALLRRRFGAGGWRERAASPGADSERLRALRRYFAGELDALAGLPLELEGNALQRELWSLLQSLPPGQCTRYGAMAEALQRPGAARAIGAALGANPLLLVLPCHRVLASNGRLHGYAGGIERKRWLLEHEGLLPRLPTGASGRALRV